MRTRLPSASSLRLLPPLLAALLSGAAPRAALALDNGLGRVPAMGYNSWYDLTGDLNETVLMATADKIKDLGLDALGYTYFNLDDDWALPNRDATTGRLVADPARFTGGTLRHLADYVHARRLKFGTYTDRGTETCGGKPGALHHEAIDAETYASWGVDYLKEDSCTASADHEVAFREYGVMRDALNKTGRPILFSLCGWNPWYAPVGASLGNSWRIGPDDTDWPGVLKNIDINSGLAEFAHAGGFNDPCLLLAEDDHGKQRITEMQTRFQFSMWAIMTSPLLISANLRAMSAANVRTFSNADVIAVNQDALAVQGRRISGGNLSAFNATNVWSKPLANGDVAMVFANSDATQARDITCDASCMKAAGFDVAAATATSVCATDLWTGNTRTLTPAQGVTVAKVPPAGGLTMFRVNRTRTECSST